MRGLQKKKKQLWLIINNLFYFLYIHILTINTPHRALYNKILLLIKENVSFVRPYYMIYIKLFSTIIDD